MTSQQQKEEQEWTNVTEKRIQAAFRLFDKENKGVVNQEEVPYIMRYLSVYPSEPALIKEIQTEMQNDEPTAFVTYAKLKSVMLRLMKTREWDPDPEDVLLQAFRTLDKENKGYIEWDKMKEILTTTENYAFREKECEQFQRVAMDMDSGNVYYEDYVALIAANEN
mmetsp:Transcript_24934/g.46896  ORF Transcript_24934/g.46896 Transcript_24934/m.46896 type:complete len:166 (+) Transcript_24934:82-579(+)|eukprot:CAMPEP_0182490658 /NCGR_PEP_ID=MMETSP1321-20130603/443_1 /TAXON_ID=91990 /ORGANISM="Bolidomonas sp., Strain RCC1657" /LENGTH=165 /DNA_ID=CAMNT_0024692881 /DNA_START=86 /DNA_END=583 /DNA_ORIENTATION=-